MRLTSEQILKIQQDFLQEIAAGNGVVILTQINRAVRNLKLSQVLQVASIIFMCAGVVLGFGFSVISIAALIFGWFAGHRIFYRFETSIIIFSGIATILKFPTTDDEKIRALKMLFAVIDKTVTTSAEDDDE
jgi:hypothetical protein